MFVSCYLLATLFEWISLYSIPFVEFICFDCLIAFHYLSFVLRASFVFIVYVYSGLRRVD